MSMTDLFSNKNCFAQLNKIESIPIFINNIEGCKYTIAIPTYKRTRDLKDAIESALGQNFQKSYNIIVVDNNPERNDETEVMMLKDYSSSKNIAYYKNTTNVGMINNWNKLFELSDTEYVVMLHDDDVIYSNFLSVMERIISQVGTFAAINAGKKSWDGTTISSVKTEETGKPIKVYNYSKYSNFAFFHFGAPSGCVFNKRLVYQEGGFDNDAYPSSDYVFIQKLSMTGHAVMQVKDDLMLYRVTNNTTSKIDTQIKWVDIDYRIKEELASLLKIPFLLKKIVEYFELKLRIREISKSDKNYIYKGYKRCGNIFLMFCYIYKFIYKRLFIYSKSFD